MHRAVVVDDERLARRELRELLAGSAEVTVVGEAESVLAAEALVRATEADVVFLDVQLGDELGFDLLPQLPDGTQVIFVTAFDRYAIRAFEQNAVDYLLKPVAPARLAAALRRLNKSPVDVADAPALAYEDFLFVRLNDRMRFVKVSHVVAVVTTGDETGLWLVGGGLVTIRRSLADWERRLPAPQFARIHRAAIVNLEHVDRVEDWSHASHLVYMRGFREPLHMSRRFTARIRARFG